MPKQKEPRIQPGDGDARHGTLNGYNNHGCRCGLCVDAYRIYRHNYDARDYVTERRLVRDRRRKAKLRLEKQIVQLALRWADKEPGVDGNRVLAAAQELRDARRR
jgi:hypothetical protein